MNENMTKTTPVAPDPAEPWYYPWPPHEHCFAHDAHEQIPHGGAFRVCPECGHVYPSRDHLVAAHREMTDNTEIDIPEQVPADLMERITSFCAYCVHDF